MSAINQSLPSAAVHQSVPSQSYPPTPVPVPVPSYPDPRSNSGPPSPPIQVPSDGTICPRHEATLVERVQFYVFKPHVLSQTSPALGPDYVAVCSACFSACVSPHPALASQFEARKPNDEPLGPLHPNSTALICDMSLPTVRQLWYRDCVPRNTIQPLVQFSQRAVALPGCTGVTGSEPTDMFASRKAEGFGICRTCFEWFIRGTAFESDMTLQSARTDWYCDIGHRGFTYRALMAELDQQRPDLRRFAAKVKQRSSVDGCPGEGNAIVPEGAQGSYYTYEGTGGKAGVFCQACFLDKVHGTSMEKFFNAYTLLDPQYYGNIACDLASTQSTFALKAAVQSGNDETWRRCVSGRTALSACVGLDGVDEESLQPQDGASSQWRCFTKHPSIEVCPFCYCAVAEVLGAGHMFSPITRPLKAGVVRMCFLTQAKDLSADVSDHRNFEDTLVWRGTILRNWLHHGFDCHGNFSGLEKAADVIAALPPPCASNRRALKPASGRKWYGNHFLAEGDEAKVGVAVCEECYHHCIKGTPLESFAGFDLTEKTTAKYPEGFVCNTTTLRSRAELKSACESGNFLQFSVYWTARADCERRRKEIDAQCNVQAARQKIMLNQINMQNQMMAVNLMQQLNANQNAVIMGVGGSVAEAASPNYGQRFGNSTVGYGYLTAGGANAAQAHVNAQNMASESQKVSLANFHASGDTWQDTQNMLALSQAIEKEWEEIR